MIEWLILERPSLPQAFVANRLCAVLAGQQLLSAAAKFAPLRVGNAVRRPRETKDWVLWIEGKASDGRLLLIAYLGKMQSGVLRLR